MTAPREPHRPPSPPDRLPSPRGGHPSSQTASAAARPAGFARLAGARRGLLSSARALAAAALLALVGGLALPPLAQPAQAQTTCTLNTGDIWCGVVTVGAQDVDGAPLYYGYVSSPSVGSLTDDSGDQSFTFGTNTHTVQRVMVTKSIAAPLYFGIPMLSTDDRARLSLHVGSDSFAFSTANYHLTFGYNFSRSGLDWSSETTVTVRLRALPPTPTNLSAAPGNEQVALSWDAPASDSKVTGHEFRYKTDGSYPATWTAIATSAVGEANEASHTVTGLTNEVAYTFELHAVNAVGAGAAPRAVRATPTPGICDRTQQVQDQIVVIVNAISGGDYDCSAVSAMNLARVTRLSLQDKGITSLQSGDFAGLTGLETLVLQRNSSLTELPSGVFSDLTAMEDLSLGDNSLTSLPDGVFSGLTALEGIDLQDNELTSLPDGVFSGLATLRDIDLQNNELGSLPDGVFSGLTALQLIDLSNNTSLGSLPANQFSGLTSLFGLELENIGMTTLPAGLFSGLTELYDNRTQGQRVQFASRGAVLRPFEHE